MNQLSPLLLHKFFAANFPADSPNVIIVLDKRQDPAAICEKPAPRQATKRFSYSFAIRLSNGTPKGSSNSRHNELP